LRRRDTRGTAHEPGGEVGARLWLWAHARGSTSVRPPRGSDPVVQTCTYSIGPATRTRGYVSGRTASHRIGHHPRFVCLAGVRARLLAAGLAFLSRCKATSVIDQPRGRGLDRAVDDYKLQLLWTATGGRRRTGLRPAACLLVDRGACHVCAPQAWRRPTTPRRSVVGATASGRHTYVWNGCCHELAAGRAATVREPLSHRGAPSQFLCAGGGRAPGRRSAKTQ
jgi:hypothetical protein